MNINIHKTDRRTSHNVIILSLAVLLILFVSAITDIYFRLAILIVLFFFTAALIFLFKKNRRYRIKILVVFILLFSALLSANNTAMTAQSLRKYDGQNVPLVCRIEEVKYSGNYSCIAVVDVLKINDGNSSGKAVLECEFQADISVGEIYKLYADIEAINLDFTDYFENVYQYSKGIYITAVCEEDTLEYIENNSFSLKNILYSYRQSLNIRLNSILGSENGSVAAALLIGKRDGLSSSLKRDLQSIGLSHIIAISGMHISIMSGAIYFILDKLKFSFRVKKIAVTVFLFLIMPLTGFMPSVMRSAAMTLLLMFSRDLRLRISMISGLIGSAGLVCLVNPNTMFDISFLMSFFSTLGIITVGSAAVSAFNSHFEGKSFYIKLLKSAYAVIITTISAQIFILPFSWIIFRNISVISPLTNIIYSPLTALIIIILPIMLICSPVKPLLLICKTTADFLITAFINLAKNLARKNYFVISLNYSFILPLIILVIGCTLAFYILVKGRKKTGFLYLVIPLLITALLFYGFYNNYTATTNDYVIATLYNKNKNDGVILLNENELYAIDMSDGSYSFAKSLFELSKDMHKNNIKYYILTHYHTRQTATLYRLMQNYYISYITIPSPQTQEEINIAETIEEYALINDCEVVYYYSDCGSIIDFYGFEYVYGGREYLSRSTHPITAFSIKTEKKTVSVCAASYFENESNYGFIKAADLVYFSSHPPVIKNNILANKISPTTYILLPPKSNVETTELNNIIYITEYEEYDDGSYIRLALEK